MRIQIKYKQSGIVISNGKSTNYREIYTLKVESINGSKEYKNTKLNLYVKKGVELEYGKKISFTRQLYKTPKGYKL